MKFLNTTAFLLISALTITAMPAWAAGSTLLFVAPSRVIIDYKKGMTTLKVANKSEKARKYRIKLVDQVMTEDGVTKRVETFPYSIKRMVRFSPREVTLNPGERQTIRIMSKRLPNLEDGDYHSHMLFSEVPLRQDPANKGQDGLSFDIQTTYGLGIPVIVRKGDTRYTLKTAKAEVKLDANEKPYIQATLNSTGNMEAAGWVFATLGEDVISTPHYIRLYREINTARKKIPLNISKNALTSGSTIHLKIYATPKSVKLLDETTIQIP